MLPGLLSEPSGSVTASQVSIALREGNIEEVFTINVATAGGAALRVDGPRFGVRDYNGTNPDQHFPELEIHVQGAPATIEGRIVASAGSTEVTDLIREAGLDPLIVAEESPGVYPPDAGRAAFDRLVELGIVEKADDSALIAWLQARAHVFKSVEEANRDRYVPAWTVQRKTTVRLGPGSDQTVTLRYSARPGHRPLGTLQNTAGAGLPAYCLSPSDLRRALAKSDGAREILVWETAIPAGIDGKAPPLVAVEAGAAREGEPRSLVAFCGSDGAPVIGAANGITGSALPDPEGIVRIVEIHVYPPR